MNCPTRVARSGGSVETFETTRYAFKKAGTDSDPTIVTLAVQPGDRVVYPAKPSSAWNNTNIRLEQAEVVSIRTCDGRARQQTSSLFADGFEYRVGETVEPESFSTDTLCVDAPGIHAHPDPKCTLNYCYAEHADAYANRRA